MKAKEFPFSTIGILLLAGYLILLGDVDNAIGLLVLFGIYKLLKS